MPSPDEGRMRSFKHVITNAALPSRNDSAYKAFKMMNEMAFGDNKKTKDHDIMIIFVLRKFNKFPSNSLLW